MSLADLYVRIVLALVGVGAFAMFVRLARWLRPNRRPSSLVLDLSPLIPSGWLRRRPPGN